MSGLSRGWGGVETERTVKNWGGGMAVLNYPDQWWRGLGGHGVLLEELE